MSKRWQYLIKAHVPAAKSPSDWNEQITLDKWEPKYPPMKRGIGLVLSAAILAGSLFFVPPGRSTNDWKETAQIDKWKPTYDDIITRPKPGLSRAIQSGSFSTAVGYPLTSPDPSWIDWYSETNRDSAIGVGHYNPGGGQSITGDGRTLDKIKFYCLLWYGATGNCYAKVYNETHATAFGTDSLPTGAALATSNPVDVSTISFIEYQPVEFTFSSPITLVNGTKYVITLEYHGTTDVWEVFTGLDSVSPTHSGNECYLDIDGVTWYADATKDLCFYAISNQGGGESTSCDKWLGHQPVFFLPKPGLSKAIQSGSFFKGTPWDAASTLETIRPDKWLPTYPDQFKVLKPVRQPDIPSVFPTETITLDKWTGEGPDVCFINTRLSRAIQTQLNAVIVPPVSPSDWKERISPDKWLGTYPDCIYRESFLSRATQSGSSFWVYWPQPSTEIITVDKWLPNYPSQLLSKVSLSRAIQSGSFFKGLPWDIASALETITIDKWLGNIPTYLFQKATLSKAIQSGSFFYQYISLEVVTLDKWQSEYPDYILKPAISKFRQPEPPFLWVPPSIEIITADKWLGRYPDYFPKSNLSRSIMAGSLFLGDIPRKETISLDKWMPSYPDRIFVKATLSKSIAAGSLFYLRYLLIEPITTYAETFVAIAKDLSFRAEGQSLTFRAYQKILSFIAKRRD